MARYGVLAVVFLMVAPCLVAQKKLRNAADGPSALDVCYSMAQNALRDVTVSQSSDASISATYSNYCYADGSTNDSAINASGSAIVEGLPIGAEFAGKDKETRFKQFCSQYQSYSSVTSSQYNYADMVVAKALDAVNQCIQAAGKNFGVSYQIITPSTLAINFTIPSGQSLKITGVTAESGVTCTGHKTGGGTITYNQGTEQDISSAQGTSAITCARTASSMNGGSSFYSDKAIVVSNNIQPLNIFWPQDSSFPVTTASTIQASINALQGQVTANKTEVEFNLLPIGTIIPWYSNAGAPPAGWTRCDGSDTAHCPNLSGRFLRGTTIGAVGAAGGSDTVALPQFGSNNRQGTGNGWSIDGDHFWSNDNLTISIVPTYTSVLYIMKINNAPPAGARQAFGSAVDSDGRALPLVTSVEKRIQALHPDQGKPVVLGSCHLYKNNREELVQETADNICGMTNDELNQIDNGGWTHAWTSLPVMTSKVK